MKPYLFIPKMSVLGLFIVSMFSPVIMAREFRSVNPISTPIFVAAHENQIAQKDLRPVSRDVVNQAVTQIAQSYNTPELQEYLSDQFIDAQRLGDTVSNLLPRDASVRILSIRDTRTLQQHIEVDESTQRSYLVSKVAVTINTQLEFDSAEGFQAIPGTTQYVLNFEEELSQGAL
ncbi:MAG: hypothetical protein COB04_09825 [Gammaproteobacteria bacterium]|nr:MAG: hypothetical protein COB04_09825 [Gammaproteobacteria bacterium]